MTVRSNRRKKAKDIVLNKKISFAALVFIAFLFLIGFIYRFTFKNAFVDQSQVSVAYSLENGGAQVKVFDFAENKVTTININKDSLVSVSTGRGQWRLEAVSKMIESEKLDWEMFSNTIMKTFGFPVDYWASPYSTNLSFLKKLRLSIFESSLSSSENIEINLEDTSAQVKGKLASGGEGYHFSGNIPSSIRQLFVNDYYASNNLKAEIIRKVDTNYESVNDFSKVLGALGVHVISIKKQEASESGCKILAKTGVNVEKIKNIFGCSVSYSSEGNFDLKIELGNGFASIF